MSYERIVPISGFCSAFDLWSLCREAISTLSASILQSARKGFTHESLITNKLQLLGPDLVPVPKHCGYWKRLSGWLWLDAWRLLFEVILISYILFEVVIF